ncbi:MAG: hypothetical protein ACE5H9_07220 [Anaerolineae bacterium]
MLAATWQLSARSVFPAFAAEAENPERRALVILSTGTDFAKASATIAAYGGHVIHRFPPDAFIADVPANSPPMVGTSAYFFGPVPRQDMAGLSPSARQAARIWNHLLGKDASPADAPIPADTHLETLPDAFEPPQSAIGAEAQASDPTPGYYETSEYLIGSVAVGLVLPESNGTTDPSTEDWTEEERALVASKIVAAMDWWAERESRANLSFIYDNLSATTVPTAVEPVSRPYYHQQYWIADTMAAMGYNSTSYFDQVRQYNNALRQQYGTDWAFTIFVVDSSQDSDNRFTDGYFAYAYLGGPFLVMTYGNNGYGPGYMDAVAAHEVGHIFMALDQYASAGQSCTRRAGYLSVENQNSELSCQSNEASIMRGQVWPYLNPAVDFYARGHIGWHDSDGDNILDPVDATIQIGNTAYITNTQMQNVLTVTGSIEEIPFPSPLRRDTLINRISQVNYRIDGVMWLAASAQDGTFNSYQEGFTFATDPMPSGNHTLELQVIDNYGNTHVQEIAQVSVIDPVEGLVNTFLNDMGASGEVTQGEVERYAGSATGSETVVTAVQYRLDGGPWQTTQAADGAFDEMQEEFLFEIDTASLDLGPHTVQARAVISGGFMDSSPASQTLDVESSNYIFLPLILSNPQPVSGNRS